MKTRRSLLPSTGIALALLLAGIALEARGAPPLAEIIASTPNRINPLGGRRQSLAAGRSACWAWTSSSGSRWGRPRPPCRSRWSSRRGANGRRAARSWCSMACWTRSANMLPAARALADAGYRAVLVDLRGRGRSTGKYMTFGLQEAKDLSQVIDALEQRGLLAGNLGVYGISYGATTSIHLAAADRRVRAVVAVEPFSTAREEVPHFARVMVPGVGLVDLRQDLPAVARRGRTDRPFRSRRGRRREGHPADLGPRAHHPRDERLGRAAPTERAFARRRAGSQRIGIGPLPGTRGALGRSGRTRGPTGPRLVRPLARRC